MLGVLNNGSVYDLTTVRLDSCASDSLHPLVLLALCCMLVKTCTAS